MLISRIIEKVIFDKLKNIVENIYYPFSSKHNQNLARLFRYIFEKCPHLTKSPHTQVRPILFDQNWPVRSTSIFIIPQIQIYVFLFFFHFKKILDLVVLRIRKSFDNDIFVPLFSKQLVSSFLIKKMYFNSIRCFSFISLIENKKSGVSLFFYRQFWSCVKVCAFVINLLN